MRIDITHVSCGMIQEMAYIASAGGRDDCAVIDPGDDFAKLCRAVGDKRVGAILLTHGHFDHIMAAGRLAERFGAPVYAGAGDMEMLNDVRLNGYLELMGGTDMPDPPISAVAYGPTLAVCGMDFAVLPTPGHSRGSVCLYLADEGLLFSGDTLFREGFGRYDLHGGDPGELARSLRKLFELPPEVKVWPGHGGATTIGAERARYSRL